MDNQKQNLKSSCGGRRKKAHSIQENYKSDIWLLIRNRVQKKMEYKNIYYMNTFTWNPRGNKTNVFL